MQGNMDARKYMDQKKKKKDSKEQMFESIRSKSNPTNTESPWVVRAPE